LHHTAGLSPPQQQQQQQSEQPRTARRSVERAVPEFYASLLQPEGSPEDTPGSLLQGSSRSSQATAQHSVVDPGSAFERVASAGALGTAEAAAAGSGPVSSGSWDPLGVATSAPPPEAAVEQHW
jgi:hypothetical protein